MRSSQKHLNKVSNNTMATAPQQPRLKLTTPTARAVYPKLHTPDTKFTPEGVYECQVVMSAEDAQPLIDKLAKFLEDAVAAEKKSIMADTATPMGKRTQKASSLKVADIPIKTIYDDDTGEPTGEVSIKFKMKASYKDKSGNIKHQKPSLFDASKPPKPLSPEVQVWGGSQVRVAGEATIYNTAALGMGISLRLSAVQVIKLVSGSGDGATADSYGFQCEEGGYESSDSDSAFSEGTETSTEDQQQNHDDF